MKETEQLILKTLSSSRLQKALSLFRAIAHPLRLKILSYIDKNKETHVNKIFGALKIEQSVASQHLRILKHAGFVYTKRNGKYIIYSVNYKKIQDMLLLLESYKIK